MANHEFLRKLGLFAVPGFLTEEECARWRELAQTSNPVQAIVYEDHQARLNEDYRKTLTVKIQDPLQAATASRLENLWPAINAHFGVEIAAMEAVQCLVYRPGDFFRAHRDVADEPQLARRLVTIVVFLNDPSCAAAPYQAGALTLYGLMETPAAAGFGFAVDAEIGLLIAFPSGMLHEVSPVVEGKRYTLVTWFLARQPENRNEHEPDIQTEATRSS